MMVWWGRFFSQNRLGRWLNIHFHGFIHEGKGGRPYALRVAEYDHESCFICRSVWAMIEDIPGFVGRVKAAQKEADDRRDTS